MLSPAKTFFPEIFEALKNWPKWVRFTLFILVIGAPLLISKFSSTELLKLGNTPLVITPFNIALVFILMVLLVWLFTHMSKKAKHKRLIYQFCEAWLEYLPFMFLLVTKIQVHDMSKDGDIFDFIKENREDIKSFHDWRAKLRELLFKVGECELAISDNQHWEKLKKESKIFEAQSYLTPFSFILDQTQPWLIAVVHQDEAWAALHISDEFIERVAFKHSNIERLWKQRIKKSNEIAKEVEENA